MKGRQQSKVQGRIKNGTLFVNISIKIQDEVEKQTDRIMKAFRKKVLGILQAIQSDLEMASGNEDDIAVAGGDQLELEQREGKLKETLKLLKNRHENILKDIS
jgi:hypothetical protein